MEGNNPYGLGTMSLLDTWRDEAARGRNATNRARANPAPTPFYRGAMPTQPDAQRDWPRGFAEGFTASKEERDSFFQPQAAAGGRLAAVSSINNLQSRKIPPAAVNRSISSAESRFCRTL